MITKEILKKEVDRLDKEHFETVYNLILSFKNSVINEADKDWAKFINSNYGCLKDSPIKREPQGNLEIREDFK